MKTHKASGWTREPLRDGSGKWRISPTNGSGERIVAFMSAGSWANYPEDNPAQKNEDRIVQLEGEPLPQWAVNWLTNANAKSCARARENFRAMIEQADFDEDRRNADMY